MTKSSYTIVFISLILLLLFSGVASASQNITNMAGVRQNHPDTNYGNDTTLYINDGAASLMRVFIELPIMSPLVNLSINIFGNSCDAGYCIINVYNTSFFNENNLTWNNQPNNLSLIGSINITRKYYNEYINITLTNPNQYILLKMDSSTDLNSVLVVSDDNLTDKPFVTDIVPSFDPSGYVKDQAGTPIADAQVSTFGGACSVLSNSNGFYDCSLFLANGTYLFTGAKVGYTSNSTSYQIVSGSGNPANLTLTATTSSPSIISWQNNKTNNNSLNFSEYPTDVIKFNATANQSITSWNWYKDSVLQVNNFDNYTTSFALGSHTISVNGTNALGTSNSITWNITQPPPDITSWGNNKTNNDTLSLSVISANIIRFNATANQSITTWQWYKDNVLQSNNYDNYTTKFLDGSHTLSVNGTNVNGVTNTITWTIASSVSYDPSGYINKTTGERVAYATVRLSNATFNTSVIANATGYWNANIYADGLYNYTVSKGGYVIASGNQTFNVGGTNNNFTLSCLGNLTACNIPDTNSRGYNVVVYDFQGNGFNLINFSWIHAISGFIFPDNTVQTTAYSPTGVNYSNLTNLPSTYPNSSIPALQSNDSYFNGSVFPNSTNFRNDSLQTQINTANTTANTANSTANNAQAALNGYNSSGYPNASLQSQINGKEPTITGSTNNVFWNGLKAWTALSSANISDIGNYLLISTYGTNFPNSTAVTANNTANTANSTANSKLTNVSAGDSVAITWSGGIAQINFSMTNISQITGSNGITTTTLSDGVGGLTNITVSGGLSATWI